MIPSRQLNSVKPLRVVKNYRKKLWLVVDQQKAWKKRKREVEKVRKALTLLMGHFDPLFLSPPPRSGSGFRKGSTQGSYFEAISGVFPYPNGSCKKIGFHIELQIYAIGIGWVLLSLPPP